jgi:hypothetical protein
MCHSGILYAVVRLTRRHLIAALGLIAFVGVVVTGGLLILQSFRPRVSEADASATALQQVRQMDPNTHGFVVVSARYNPAPDRVTDDHGNVIYSESHSSCQVWIIQGPAWLCHAAGAWIVHLRAPAQGEFSDHEAYVIVNGQTGIVSSASTNSTNGP